MLMGDTVGLRPVEEEDLPLLVEWRNDPAIRQVFCSPFPISCTGQHKWYEHLQTDPTRVQFMIVRLSDGRTVGTVGLHAIDQRNQNAEAGPIIIAPEERGQELAQSAVRVLFNYAFQDLNLRRLYIDVLDFNGPGLHQAHKVGFVEEGIFRQAAFIRGEFHDVVRMSILREEWRC